MNKVIQHKGGYSFFKKKYNQVCPPIKLNTDTWARLTKPLIYFHPKIPIANRNFEI
jgi:hypothetical protein